MGHASALLDRAGSAYKLTYRIACGDGMGLVVLQPCFYQGTGFGSEVALELSSVSSKLLPILMQSRYEVSAEASLRTELKRKLQGDVTAAFQHSEGLKRKKETLFIRVCCYWTRDDGFKQRGETETRYKEVVFYPEGGETIEQAAQRGCGHPIPGIIQGHIGWGFE